MKFVDEYRDRRAAETLSRMIGKLVTRPWTMMEICGGQTHTIMKSGLEALLPGEVRLIHGPGCPVCVTSVGAIDTAIALASRPGMLLASFGDMLRVPGSEQDLLAAKASGGDVRMVYSPLDALDLAARNPGLNVVFFGVGFETTAPAAARAVVQARHRGVRNFFLLSCHVRVAPAVDAILSSPGCLVQGLIAPGHVCAVTGTEEYVPLAARHRVPIVVTGFEPVDILQGIFMTAKQLEEGRCDVEIQYSRAVRREGNIPARRLLEEVFEITGCSWRGLGEIPASGYRLSEAYAEFDAERVFPVEGIRAAEPEGCAAGDVLRGMKKPPECGAFASRCTPEHPLGAPMVSSEGACAAYYRYSERAFSGAMR